MDIRKPLLRRQRFKIFTNLLDSRGKLPSSTIFLISISEELNATEATGHSVVAILADANLVEAEGRVPKGAGLPLLWQHANAHNEFARWLENEAGIFGRVIHFKSRVYGVQYFEKRIV